MAAVAMWLGGLAVSLDRAHPLNLDRYHDLSTLVVDRDGKIVRAFLSTDDKWRLSIDPHQVDPTYLTLLKAYEDKRFESHFGVDPLAVLRALGQWVVNGHVVSGASTLTMQTARLLEPRPRTLFSKVIEMGRAVQLEWHLTKQEILSIYLTLAPYGGNIEGIRAASLAYFQKEPMELTLSQAALLVALPQSPERLRPDRNGTASQERRDYILDRMAASELVPRVDALEAQNIAVPRQRHALPFHAPRLAQLLKSRRSDPLVQTTLKIELQRSLEELLHAEAHWQDAASMAAIIVDNRTREILAYLGGTDFWGPAGQVNLARAPRSPGSTLKPFIYGLAFDDLLVHPETLIEDLPIVFGDYAPQNFDRNFQGTVSVRQALRYSLNVPAVALLNKVGPVRFASTLGDAGAQLHFARRGIAPSLPLALGGVGLSLEDLTMLYAGLANDGETGPLKVLAADPDRPTRRLLSAASAWYVEDILKGTSMPDGWGQRSGFDRRHQVAFKTGTSYGFRDAWSVGYTDRYTVGVWVGRADGTPRPGSFGRNTAAPLLLKVFDLLPHSVGDQSAPPENVIAVNHRDQLPVNMRRFEGSSLVNASKPGQKHVTRPPRIRFPGHGISVAMPEDQTPLALKASGGEWPLRWIVNGQLLPQQGDFLETSFWQPDGLGFADIVVVDAAGRSARSQIRLIPEKKQDNNN